ncbi:MAG: FtsW/RodA/SpoVE family cell cycle protein [Propionibacteriales bacterium]|nr:FtsW/RodA/SpoVE family cell cycle protein [Propionibacteriales bacterium]
MSSASPSAGRLASVFVPRKRRGAELFLLFIALVVGVGAYALVGLGTEQKVPADIVEYGGGLVGLAVVCHVVVRLRAPYADPVILPAVVALNGLGLAMIHRIDVARVAADRTAQTYATQQLLWTGLSVVCFVATLLVIRDHRRLQAFTYTSGFAGIVLLLLPLIPGLGVNINGARIWIRLVGFSFQPGEIAKICLAVFFAGYLVVKREALALAGRRFLGVDLPRGRDLGPILAMWIISLGVLVFQRDLGSSLLFFGLFVVLLYVATERPSWLFVGVLLFTGGAYAGYLAFSHVQTRVAGWLHPFSNPDDYYQIIQGQYGLAWGGILGRGLGGGSPQLTPYAWSDFIGTSLGEELGLTGLMAIIVVYGLIVERGLRTALVCRDPFGKLLSVGLSVAMALQVFVVVGGVTKLIPLTGLTTPFLSYGGSSLIANWIIAALILRISHQARRPVPDLHLPSADDETQVVKMR